MRRCAFDSLRRERHRVNARRAARQIVDFLADDCAFDLEHRRFNARCLPCRRLGNDPHVGRGHRHQINLNLRNTRCEMRVLDERLAARHLRLARRLTAASPA